MRTIIKVTSAAALLAFGSPALAQQQNAMPESGGQNAAAGADTQVQQVEPNVTVVQPGQQTAPEVRDEQTSQEPGAADRPQLQDVNPAAPAAAIGPTAPMADPRLMANQVSGLIGTNAVTVDNEDIGEIENLLIGSDGQVEAAIVEWGGFLGIGSRTAAVPWNELRLNEAQDRVVIDMTRAEMEALPAYDGDPASVAGIDADAKPAQ